MKIFIVKVQQSIQTGYENPQMLIYDKNRKYTFQSDISDDVKSILNGRLKAYFNAGINDDNMLEIREEVESQEW
jgi:hypothetical protein